MTDLRNEPGCPWCGYPVPEEGDTCDPGCYVAWFVWAWGLSEQEEAGFISNPEWPKSAPEQRWYRDFIGIPDAEQPE